MVRKRTSRGIDQGCLILVAGWDFVAKSDIPRQYLSQTNNLFKHHGHHSFKCFTVGFAIVCDFAVLQDIRIIGQW